jgi:hypothetical protein
MPHYQVIFKNKSNPLFPDNYSQTEYCTADDLAQADAMVRRDCGRFVDVEQHSWTITEIPSLPE